MTGGRRRASRHPRAIELMAWHDGERHDAALTLHIQACDRCWAEAAGFAAVDRVVRRAATNPSTRPPTPATRDRRRRSPIAVRLGAAVVIAVAVAALAPAVSVSADLSRSVLTGMLHAAQPSASSQGSAEDATTAPAAAHDRTPTADAGLAEAARDTPPARRTAATAEGAGRRAAGAGAEVQGPLRLALPLPGGVRSRADGADDMRRAVHAAVAAANAGGGVEGVPVSVEVIDSASFPDAAGSYDVLVGGLPADASERHEGVPWILPANPFVRGREVVTIDPAPADASHAVAAQVGSRSSTVAVLDDGGMQSPLGAGFPVAVRVRVDGDERCDRAVREARSGRASVVVLALEPAALERCLEALRRSTWSPRRGVVLPSYTAFDLPSTSVRSADFAALPLPWPSWDEPATARFRAATGGSTSYRALVSFVAAELAIAVAREGDGQIDAARVARGSWQTDLWSFEDGASARLRVARRVLFGWSPADRSRE